MQWLGDLYASLDRKLPTSREYGVNSCSRHRVPGCLKELRTHVKNDVLFKYHLQPQPT